MSERIVTLPNALTLSRIPMAAALWLAPERAALVGTLMVAAAVTDVLDGRFARAVRARRGRRGEELGDVAGARGIGAWLDPLCDKVFVLSLLVAIFVVHRPGWLVAALIAAREVVLVPLVALYRFHPTLRSRLRFDLRAGPLGKAATVAQFAAIGSILIDSGWTFGLAATAGALGLAATASYVKRAVDAAHAHPRGA